MLEPIFKSSRHKGRVYTALLDTIGCGPFDGGCLAFATAMQRLHGGEVQVIVGSIEGRPAAAQHAVLRLPDGSYLDADGQGSQREVIDNFVAAEIHPYWGSFNLEAVRSYKKGDLPEAPCDDRVIDAVCAAWTGAAHATPGRL